jgi:hypothetical protein
VVLAIVNASGVSIPGTAYLALALTVVTIGVFVGIWFGRARWLIALGVLLSILLSVGTITRHAGLSGSEWPAEDQSIIPTSAEQVSAGYHSGAGDFDLDLRAVDFTGIDRTVQIDSGFGDTHVELPPNVDVTVEWQAGAGDIDVLGQHQSGVGQNGSITDNGVNGADTSNLILKIHHGAGDLEVTR